MTTVARRSYKDVICYQSRRYRRRARHLVQDSDIQLGHVVFQVLKTLATNHDPRNAPALTDQAATLLPTGTPVYEVTGYSTDRILAAVWNDRLHVYDVVDEEQGR